MAQQQRQYASQEQEVGGAQHARLTTLPIHPNTSNAPWAVVTTTKYMLFFTLDNQLSGHLHQEHGGKESLQALVDILHDDLMRFMIMSLFVVVCFKLYILLNHCIASQTH